MASAEGDPPRYSTHISSVYQQKKIPVGILGATGTVGQRFIQLLQDHPWFRVAALGGSNRTNGMRYAQAATWRLAEDAPLLDLGQIEVTSCDPKIFRTKGCLIIFSALASDVAGEQEKRFAEEGFLVFSNASYWRSVSTVPILLPYVNSKHLDLLRSQDEFKVNGGGIVTNANCASTGLAVALAPVVRKWGIERLSVATLQACSGAGYPGISALDILDNVVPYIAGEESKLEWEPQKILGTLRYVPRQLSKQSLKEPAYPAYIEPAMFESTATCHRVPVFDGHTITVSLDLPSEAFPAAMGARTVAELIQKEMSAFKPPLDVEALPSCPKQVLFCHQDVARPQPRLDKMRGSGMCTSVGPVRTVFLQRHQIWVAKFTLLVHNTVLGAAGCSILNAELALSRGFVSGANIPKAVRRPLDLRRKLTDVDNLVACTGGERQVKSPATDANDVLMS